MCYFPESSVRQEIVLFTGYCIIGFGGLAVYRIGVSVQLWSIDVRRVWKGLGVFWVLILALGLLARLVVS